MWTTQKQLRFSGFKGCCTKVFTTTTLTHKVASKMPEYANCKSPETLHYFLKKPINTKLKTVAS